MFDLFALGSVNVDMIGFVDAYPEPNVKIQICNLQERVGGPSSTAAVTASFLGLGVAFCGIYGDDKNGEEILDFLKFSGIDTSSMKRRDGHGSRFAFVINDPDSRTIFWSNDDLKLIAEEELPYEMIKKSRAIHIDEYEWDAAVPAAKYAKREGVKVFVDIESVNETTLELASLADYLVIPEIFGVTYTGEYEDLSGVAKKIFDEFKVPVVLTCGKNGAYCCSEEGQFHQAIFDIPVKDTTGAGDVFHGAFIYSTLKGMSLQDAVRFATAASAVRCNGPAAKNNVPSTEEIEKVLASNIDRI